MNHVLKLNNISYSYHTPDGETPAIKNISLSVEKGEFISIVGPSGCGKSTLLSLISGLIAPDTGTIELHGSSNIGYMFQKDNLFEWRTVYGNAILGLDIQHRTTPGNLAYVNSLLTAYGLDSFKDSRPSQLSGGMRQRAALIRTLALEPDILLLDEPFSALDYQTRLEVCDDIGSIIKKEEKTALLVTHDLSEAISMGDRVVVLTGRPCSVRDIIAIELSVENRTPLSSRNAPEFKDYFNLIWKELTDND